MESNSFKLYKIGSPQQFFSFSCKLHEYSTDICWNISVFTMAESESDNEIFITQSDPSNINCTTEAIETYLDQLEENNSCPGKYKPDAIWGARE